MATTHIDLREINHIGERTRERLIRAERCRALASEGLRVVGHSSAERGFRFVRRSPGFAQTLVCVGGSGRVLVDGAWRTLAPGEAYLTPAARRHAYQATGAWRLVWAHIAPARQARYGIEAGGPRVVDGAVADLEALVLGLDRELHGRDEAAARAAWVALLARQLRRIGGGDGDRLERVWEIVRGDLARPWTLGELAALAEVGGEQLRRRCRARYGVSPMRQLAHLRCEHAAALLAATDSPVAAIAEAVGYANPFAFSTAFRRWAGASPSAWRAWRARRAR